MRKFKTIMSGALSLMMLAAPIAPAYGLSSLSDGATVLPLPEPTQPTRLPQTPEYYTYTLHGVTKTYEGHWPWPTLEVAREQARVIAERWCAPMADAPGWPQYDRGYCVKYNTHQVLVQWRDSLLDDPTM
jgi:hypothetical protein